MLKSTPKLQNRQFSFVCQVTESALKVIKCQIINPRQRRLLGLEKDALTASIDDKQLIEKLKRILQKLEYKNQPVTISLPRASVTSRFLKVPAQTPKEIEKIVTLQAARYLPYPAHELVCAYQVMQVNSEGYAELNLVIAHKNIIQRYLNIFQELTIPPPKIVLSSYGLCNLYNFIKPSDSAGVIIIDIDAQQAEVVIIRHKKMLFSRSFRLSIMNSGWESSLADEITRTSDAYLKEVNQEVPDRAIVTGKAEITAKLADILNRLLNLSVEPLSFTEKINLENNLSQALLNSDDSFASLIGLGLGDVPESLNLLPQDLKAARLRTVQRKKNIRTGLCIAGIIFMLSLAWAKNLQNKAEYLKKLKWEINKIAQEAQPLEEAEKRLKLLASRTQQKPTGLEALYGLYQAAPESISLVSFSYEEDNQIIFRGQAPELNAVLSFVSNLKKSGVFNNLNIKVRYATTKKTQFGTVVDFEIVCLNK